MVRSLLIRQKSGQAWSLDAVMAIVIFTVAIIALFFYAVNFLSKSDEKLEEIFYEGNVAAAIILSNDYPGILTDERVDQAKLDDFAGNYISRKGAIGINREFYFRMDYLEINGVPAEYVGQINTTQTENLVQITRITIYKDSPVKFQLYIWE